MNSMTKRALPLELQVMLEWERVGRHKSAGVKFGVGRMGILIDLHKMKN